MELIFLKITTTNKVSISFKIFLKFLIFLEETANDQEILESAWSKSKQTTDGKVKSQTIRKPRPKLTEMELIQSNGLPALKALFDDFQPSDSHGPVILKI